MIYDRAVVDGGTMASPIDRVGNCMMNDRNWLGPGLLLAGLGLFWLVVGGNGEPALPAVDATPQSAEYDPNDWRTLEFIPAVDFREIFHFDVTPQWISSRWQRVSQTTNSEGWSLHRVPLVTGTNGWDIHGSLTYSFDAQGTLKRIHFAGWTADTSLLESTLTQNFGFSPEKTGWLGAFTRKSLGQLTGVALFRLPEIRQMSAANQQIAVWLEINDPRFRGRASAEASELLKNALTSHR